MFSYDNKFFYRNVCAMSNFRKMTFADIESAGELSPGTIARLEYSGVVPPLGVVFNVAEVLRCPIDLLVHTRLDAFIKDDFLLTDFIQKLVDETQTGAIIWKGTDGIYSAGFIDGKDIYISGAPVDGAWKPLAIWIQDAVAPVTAEGAAPTTDAAEESASSEPATEPVAPKKYIVFDEKLNKDPHIYRIVRNFVQLVQAAAERLTDAETLTIMRDFLAKNVETPAKASNASSKPVSSSDDKSIAE